MKLKFWKKPEPVKVSRKCHVTLMDGKQLTCEGVISITPIEWRCSGKDVITVIRSDQILIIFYEPVA